MILIILLTPLARDAPCPEQCDCADINRYANYKSNKKAVNRNWRNQKANPALNLGNNQTYK